MIAIFTVPGQITDLKTASIDSKSISVSWSDPVYHGNGLDGYEVQYNAGGSWMKKQIDFGQKRAVLSGLSPYTTYTVTVSAKSFSGTGPPSTPTKATTMEASE